ncbi:type II toxin-antitoxin system RelE/ParE family toxin [Nonomuraea sp. B19D2]|uniref:type II toxin-antitoxin system RelE/ParE family toxin n=1 Tax=Nonomuraea sp. B19D2 TaxID=3159561 RepID=UPI0032DB8D9A
MPAAGSRLLRHTPCLSRSALQRPRQELRPACAGRSEIRILFVFDPWRAAILLVAGDKAGNWRRWYQTSIPRAERLYEQYLAEREKEMRQ